MKIGWRGALGFVLSAALLWFALRDIHFADVARAVAAAHPPLLALAAVVATCTFPTRAMRWRPILATVAPRLPFAPLWHGVAIGFMITNVVPVRAGELARAFVLSRERPDVPFSASFASVGVDRLFDAVVIISMMLLATVDPAFPSGTPVAGFSVLRWAGVLGAVVAVGVAGLGTLAWFPATIERLFELLAGRVAPGIEERGIAFIRNFASGLGVLRHPGRAIEVLLWTILHWSLNAVAFWIGFRAVGIAVPLSAAFFLQGLIAVGSAVPVAPGFFGLFEALGKVGLGIYGTDATLAVTWAIAYHVVTYIPITAIGAWYFGQLGVSLGEMARSASRGEGTG